MRRPDRPSRNADHPDHPCHPADVHDHDRGLQFDIDRLISRRRALTLFGGVGAVGAAALAGCGLPSETTDATGGSTTPSTAAGSSTTGSTATASTATTATTAATASTATTASSGTCTAVPQETAGPYPGDGSNGPNVLKQSGIVRQDIRSSFGSASGVATGVPLTVALKVLSIADGCSPLVGAAVYLWHCNIDGLYSMYSQGIANENYLRGVQATDANGEVGFTSIFPAAYSGRWPHIHFEVYPSLVAATSAGTKLRTSQMALPEDACDEVYATTGYHSSIANLARTSLATDNVFTDGWSSQLGTVSGSPTSGMTASLTVAV